MTVHQKAYDLIDQLDEEDIQAVIQIMIRMLPAVKKEKNDSLSDSISPKMKAFLRMEQLRKETAKYDVSEKQRSLAMEERFGTVL